MTVREPLPTPQVVIIHGIHVTDPHASVGRLAPAFKAIGWPVVVYDYGRITALQARRKNVEVVDALERVVRPGAVLVGHSNGALIAWMFANRGHPLSGAVLINPALRRDARFPPWVRWIHVYHNRGDRAVALSRLFFARPWGAMGQLGPSYDDPRLATIDCAHRDGLPRVWGHNAILRDPCVGPWSRAIAKRAEQAQWRAVCTSY